MVHPIDSLQFRLAFNLRPALHADLMTHLVDIPKRDWPAVFVTLAQIGLASSSTALAKPVVVSNLQLTKPPVPTVDKEPLDDDSGLIELSLDDAKSAFMGTYVK